jgi:hypothetical protein
MSEALQQSVQPALLHIVGSAIVESTEAVAVGQWIDQSGMEVVRCPDVYLGLARALGKSPRDLRAVIVCVEDLLADEFEFFPLLARARRDLPVLVYGARSPELIVRALQLGARGLVTREAVLALGARLERPFLLEEPALAKPRAAVLPSPEPLQSPNADRACSIPEAAPVIAPSPATPAVKCDVNSSLPDAQIEEIEDEPREGAGPIAAARVPWLRYNDGPARQRPSSPKQDRVETSPTGGIHDAEVGNGRPPTHCKREYEPLLTEQELAALLGDDFDDTALREREMLTGDGEVPGSGTR